MISLQRGYYCVLLRGGPGLFSDSTENARTAGEVGEA